MQSSSEFPTVVRALLTYLLLVSPVVVAELPPITDSDLAAMPAADSSPLFWQGESQIAGFRNMDRITPSRTIARGETVLTLPSAANASHALDLLSFAGETTTAQYMIDNRVGGLVVIKDNQIVYEKYGLGNNEKTRWVSFSVAKSVVSLLYGAALQDGYIESLDENVTDYLPRLKGSSYDQTTIRNLLQMASGVRWNEDYDDPKSDIATATFQTLPLYEFLRNKPRDAEPGTKFNYNTAETNLAGTLLRSAIGNNLATYLTDKIWRPFGMEADASWQLTEAGGGEFGGCCINATLRDYARIGLFALNNGVLKDGKKTLPDDWMAESVKPSEGFDGYGYFWWLKPGGAYEASGIFGQGIYINPQHNIVIAIHSARVSASTDSDWALQDALYAAIVRAVKDN